MGGAICYHMRHVRASRLAAWVGPRGELWATLPYSTLLYSTLLCSAATAVVLPGWCLFACVHCRLHAVVPTGSVQCTISTATHVVHGQAARAATMPVHKLFSCLWAAGQTLCHSFGAGKVLGMEKNSLPPVNWRWVEEGDGYVGRLQPSGQPLGDGSSLANGPPPLQVCHWIQLDSF
jgi:hypothetical protein